MHPALHEGQRFVITNPDYNVVYEVWQIITLSPPAITFCCERDNAVDIAYVPYFVTETVHGTIVSEADDQVIVALTKHSSWEEGVLLSRDKATYLARLNPLRHA